MHTMPGGLTDDLVRRVQCEFLEMPGLRLTEKQAGRLWGLDASRCSAVLHSLIEAGFLARTRDGAYVRVEHATLVHAHAPFAAAAGAAGASARRINGRES